MSDYLSDIEWESGTESDSEKPQSDLELEIPLDGSLPVASSSSSSSSQKNNKRIKLTNEDHNEAKTRHKEDLLMAISNMRKYSKVCSNDMLQSILLSYLPSSTSIEDHEYKTLENLTSALQVFRTTFTIQYAKNKKLRDKFQRLESKYDTPSFLIEHVLQKGWGNIIHIYQLLCAYLISLKYDVRLVTSIQPCSHSPYQHNDIKKSTIKKSMKNSTTRSSNSISNMKDNIIVIDDDSDSDEDDSMDEDNYGNKDDYLCSPIWLEVYLNQPYIENPMTHTSYTTKNTPTSNSSKSSSSSSSSSSSKSDDIRVNIQDDAMTSKRRRKTHDNSTTSSTEDSNGMTSPPMTKKIDHLIEQPRWVHVDYIHSLIDSPNMIGNNNTTITTTHSTTSNNNGGNNRKNKYVSYVVAVDSLGRCTDVTARYTNQYHFISSKYRLPSTDIEWWNQLLHDTHIIDNIYSTAYYIPYSLYEQRRAEEYYELQQYMLCQSTLPSSVQAFKSHPIYVLERDLAWNEIPRINNDDDDNHTNMNKSDSMMASNTSSSSSSSTKEATNNVMNTKCKDSVGSSIDRDSKVYCHFKGEKVYLRQDIETLYSKRDWYKLMRIVQPDQVESPTKIIKRKINKYYSKSKSSNNDVYDTFDGNNSTNHSSNTITREIKLYRYCQTIPYQVPLLTTDGKIPVNNHGNYELWDSDLRLVPHGAQFIPYIESIKIAQQLGLHYAPALVGFESKADRKIPKYGGILVLQQDANIILEALSNVIEHKEIQRNKKIELKIINKWEYLVNALLTRQRLRRTYGH